VASWDPSACGVGAWEAGGPQAGGDPTSGSADARYGLSALALLVLLEPLPLLLLLGSGERVLSAAAPSVADGVEAAAVGVAWCRGWTSQLQWRKSSRRPRAVRTPTRRAAAQRAAQRPHVRRAGHARTAPGAARKATGRAATARRGGAARKTGARWVRHAW